MIKSILVWQKCVCLNYHQIKGGRNPNYHKDNKDKKVRMLKCQHFFDNLEKESVFLVGWIRVRPQQGMRHMGNVLGTSSYPALLKNILNFIVYFSLFKLLLSRSQTLKRRSKKYIFFFLLTSQKNLFKIFLQIFHFLMDLVFWYQFVFNVWLGDNPNKLCFYAFSNYRC